MNLEETKQNLKALEQFSEKMRPKPPTIQDYLAGFHFACKVTKDLTETVSPLLETFLSATQPPKGKKRRAKQTKKNQRRRRKKR